MTKQEKIEKLKVDIIKEELNTYSDVYREVEVPPIYYASCGEGELPTTEQVMYKERIYKAHLVIDNDGRSLAYYVQDSDKGIFEGLMSVTNESINKKIKDGVEAIIRIERLKREDIIAGIKRLSWYRRLFNNF